MNRTASFLAALGFTVGLATPSIAMDGQGRGKVRSQAAKQVKHESKQQKLERKQQTKFAKADRKNDDRWVFDRDSHARVIRDYRRSGSLPPGLANRESLPPGLRRQLRERGQLPPGLQKRLVGVPDALESRLPGLPRYYDRYFAGDDLVVVDSRTNTIAAIVRDVLR